MSAQFHESYVDISVPPPSDRATGLTLAALAALLAVLNRNSASALTLLGLLSVVLAVCSLAAPAWLAPVNRAWYRLGRLLHHVMSPLVMGLVFVTTIVPIGLLMRRTHDPLRRHAMPAAETYWIAIEGGETGRSSMVNQF